MTEDSEHGDRLPTLAKWRVLVIGLGMTGRSAAAFCAARGAKVLAVDERPLANDAGLEALAATGVELRTESEPPPLGGFDLVVPSPGVPRARYAGARRAWGDIELAARALRVPLVAVTGTNGKSTTVRLIEAMLRSAGLRARAAGNIGAPALSLVGEPLDVAILEVSSFQLEAVEALRPRVAVVLNITPDHLDRHGSFSAYVDAKAALLARQQQGDVAVLNLDDPVVRELESRTRARVIGFCRQQPLAPGQDGVQFDLGRILVCVNGNRRALAVDPSTLSGLAGVHNQENLLAAVATVVALGADAERATGALLTFAPLPHRCETVAQAGGVTFIDDSKATNAGAAARSLESFASKPPRILWVAGGRAKGARLDALAEAASGRVRQAFLIGEAAHEIEAAVADLFPVSCCDSIEDAVAAAAAVAREGDVVLLAPGCASFDQFTSFEERGERFGRAARRAADGLASEGEGS